MSMDTNYALMITGGWGTGKTHFFKSILSKEIEKVPIEGSELKYKTILVSLFGVKSIGEIQQAILLALGRIPNGDGAKVLINITSSILGKFIGKEAIDSISKTNIKNIVDFKKCVLCLDDFERISSKLSIEEVVGFVNSLTEDVGAKVILISNENEIVDKANYKKIKEKVVGNTIEFTPDIDVSFEEILNEKRFDGELKEILLTRRRLILSLFSPNVVNLRTLLYAVSYFEKIYLATRDLLSAAALKRYYDTIITDLIRFTFSISIAYKNEEIGFKNKRGIHLLDNNLPDVDKRIALTKMIIKSDSNQDDKEYRDSFWFRFYQKDEAKLHFYQSIYDFLTGGSILDSEMLKYEIKEAYHIEKNEIPPHYELTNKLGYNQYRDLSDDEYKELTRQMLSYCEQGLYKLDEHLTIFSFITRHDNILKYNLSKLEKRIIKGIKKGKENGHYEYMSGIDIYLDIDQKAKYKENLEAIKRIILQVNEELRLKENKDVSSQLESLFYTDSDAFYNEILNNNQYLNQPIFNDFKFQKLYSTLIHADNKFRRRFYKFLYSRHEKMNRLPEEREFFLKLEKLFEKKIEKMENSISKLSYQALLAEIKKTIGPTK
jgi:hypothetical protein